MTSRALAVMLLLVCLVGCETMTSVETGEATIDATFEVVDGLPARLGGSTASHSYSLDSSRIVFRSNHTASVVYALRHRYCNYSLTPAPCSESVSGAQPVEATYLVKDTSVVIKMGPTDSLILTGNIPVAVARNWDGPAELHQFRNCCTTTTWVRR